MLGGRSRNSKDMGYICIFLALSLLHWSGRPEEFHLQSPTDPYVNLSIHTAPASLTLETSRFQSDAGSETAPPSPLVGCHRLQAGSSPSLQPYYRTFITTTG
jgi:hypothetical protein